MYVLFFITFTGPVDLCKSNPCLNGGTCMKGEMKYTCSCNNYFTGHKCESKYGINICLRPGEYEHETE